MSKASSISVRPEHRRGVCGKRWRLGHVPRLRSARTGVVGLVALVGLGFTLSGCGLSPVYQSGGSGAVASALGTVEVGPIAGQSGWLMRNALNDRLTRGSQGQTARYRLEVELDDSITGFGVRADNAVTRERRTLRARYRLVAADRGTVVLDASAGADAGIDVLGSEYATVAAEQSALERLAQDLADQIVSQLALYARRNP